MRSLLLCAVVAISACGAAPEDYAAPYVDDTDTSMASDSLDSPVAEYGEQGAEVLPTPQCLYFAPDALEAFPGLRDATHNAAGRWFRWYPEGGEECSVRIILSDVPKVAQGWHSDTISGVRINPAGPVIDGNDCSGNNVLLIDLMAHELGHAFGLDHGGNGAMAATHGACSTSVPTRAEIALANGCGSWGPTNVADCP